jgi:hypothetical protein
MIICSSKYLQECGRICLYIYMYMYRCTYMYMWVNMILYKLEIADNHYDYHRCGYCEDDNDL